MTKLLFDRVYEFFAGVEGEGSKELKQELEGATVFFNGDALQRALDGEIDISDIGSMAPPYPTFFVEFMSPSGVIEKETLGGKIAITYGNRTGILFVTYDLTKEEQGKNWIDYEAVHPKEVRWTMTGYVFVQNLKQEFSLLGITIIVLDNEGKPTPVKTGDQIGDSYFGLEKDFIDGITVNLGRIPEEDIRQDAINATIDAWYNFAENAIAASLFTIGMLHCKNIGTQEVIPGAGESRKWERKTGHAMSRYHVLTVTGKGRAAGMVIGQPTGLKMPLHTVRAHFKHYTEDAPLLGKHVGSWYWQDGVRGSAKEGIVTKDYEVKGDNE